MVLLSNFGKPKTTKGQQIPKVKKQVFRDKFLKNHKKLKRKKILNDLVIELLLLFVFINMLFFIPRKLIKKNALELSWI